MHLAVAMLIVAVLLAYGLLPKELQVFFFLREKLCNSDVPRESRHANI